jgi:hypothetical protein
VADSFDVGDAAECRVQRYLMIVGCTVERTGKANGNEKYAAFEFVDADGRTHRPAVPDMQVAFPDGTVCRIEVKHKTTVRPWHEPDWHDCEHGVDAYSIKGYWEFSRRMSTAVLLVVTMRTGIVAHCKTCGLAIDVDDQLAPIYPGGTVPPGLSEHMLAISVRKVIGNHEDWPKLRKGATLNVGRYRPELFKAEQVATNKPLPYGAFVWSIAHMVPLSAVVDMHR